MIATMAVYLCAGASSLTQVASMSASCSGTIYAVEIDLSAAYAAHTGFEHVFQVGLPLVMTMLALTAIFRLIR